MIDTSKKVNYISPDKVGVYFSTLEVFEIIHLN